LAAGDSFLTQPPGVPVSALFELDLPNDEAPPAALADDELLLLVGLSALEASFAVAAIAEELLVSCLSRRLNSHSINCKAEIYFMYK